MQDTALQQLDLIFNAEEAENKDSDINNSKDQEASSNNKQNSDTERAEQEVTDKSYAWTDSDDVVLLNHFLLQAKFMLSSDELTPKELGELISAVDTAIRRKRILERGYDTVPVGEMSRQAEEKKKDTQEEEKRPIATLHPDQNVANL